MKKYFNLFIVIILLSIFSIGFTSALDTLKPAELNQEYTILQTCANCSYINMSVSNLNGLVIENGAMNNNGSGTWTYNYTPVILGRHDVTGIGDLDGTDTSFATYFLTTPNGEELTVGQSIIYLIFIFILFGLISILFYFIVIIPKNNEKDENGHEVKIIRMKYLRVFFIGLVYGMLIILLNLTNGIAVNFSSMSIFSGTIGFLFLTMLRLAWPFTFILILWILYMLIHDSNISKNIAKIGRIKL